MEQVSGFWLGAAALFSARRANELRDAAGGWDGLRSCGEDDLIDIGVPELKAKRWRRYPSGQTMGTVLIQDDPRYPSDLRNDNAGAPPVLFVEGNTALLQRPGIAIVGTRGCTARGRSLAQYLGAQLSKGGWTVVSGLARGIDAAAHQGAADSGNTVAVLGHGLGSMSPVSNTGLRRRIVASGGAVVSTWPDDEKAERWTFPARNRWIAGLSRRVVVVEAPEGSGALYTVEAAIELDRPVHLVPAQPGSAVASGCLAALQDAQSERSQFMMALEQRIDGDPEELSHWLRQRRDLIKDPVTPVWDVAKFLADVARCEPDIADLWLQAVFAGRPLDEVCQQRGISVIELLSELAVLELNGQVVRLPGQRYAAGNRSCTP